MNNFCELIFLILLSPLCILYYLTKSLTPSLQLMLVSLHVAFIAVVPEISIIILPTENLQINGRIHRRCIPFDSISESMESYSFRWINERHKTVSHDAILQIPINDASVLGEYECQYTADNSLRVYSVKTFAKEISSSIQSVQRYEIGIFPYPSRFKMNERFTLRCHITPDLENVKYEWSKGGFFYKNVQTLIFPKFSKADTDVYKCRAIGFTDKGVKIDLVSEISQTLSYFSHREIELTSRPGPDIALNKGEMKELHCELDGSDNIVGRDVHWYFNGVRINEDALNALRLVRFNKRFVSILIMSRVDSDNEGKYECQIGFSRREAYVVINEDGGLIVVNPRILTVLEGEPVEFHCQSDSLKGIDNTKLIWKVYDHNGALTANVLDNGWTVTTPKSAELTSFITMSSVKLSDGGYVVCNAPNGMTERAQLIVQQKHVKFNVTVTPSQVVVRQNQLFEFDCFGQKEDGTPYGKPVIKLFNGSSTVDGKTFVITDVSASRVRITAPSGISVNEELKISCTVGEKTRIVNIVVQDACPSNHRHCRNGQCLLNGKFCDGRRDCNDGSDEDSTVCDQCEPTVKPCHVVNGVLPKLKFANVNWLCDGEDDCGNGSDEQNCSAMDAACDGTYFTCGNNVTIPRGYVCDGTPDCVGFEDEVGCTKPTILHTSEPLVTARLGHQVTLQCEVTAHPLPTILWRYNWKCLPDSSRMRVSLVKKDCRSVVSTLTIDNFRHGDDAIYNCEAISYQSRVMSNDFQITIV